MHTVTYLHSRRSKKGQHVVSVPPREMLKALIERSGLSQSEVAKKMGFASPSGLNRYIREATQRDDPIPVDVVKRLVPILRGIGHPVITQDDIMSLTTLPISPGSGREQPIGGGSLEVKYRVEAGTYHKLADIRSIGRSAICPAADYPAGAQFVAMMGKDQLHCVDKSQFTPTALMGRRALLAVRYGQSDLYQVEVGTIGEKMPGTVLGVIIGQYSRE